MGSRRLHPPTCRRSVPARSAPGSAAGSPRTSAPPWPTTPSARPTAAPPHGTAPPPASPPRTQAQPHRRRPRDRPVRPRPLCLQPEGSTGLFERHLQAPPLPYVLQDRRRSETLVGAEGGRLRLLALGVAVPHVPDRHR